MVFLRISGIGPTAKRRRDFLSNVHEKLLIFVVGVDLNKLWLKISLWLTTWTPVGTPPFSPIGH